MQEALASLCMTVCEKLITTDSVLAARFDEIAAGICLDTGMMTANMTFAALAKEAGEVVEKRKA